MIIVLKEPEVVDGVCVCGWGLETDPLNYILTRIKTNLKKDSKNFGKLIYSREGYYQNLDSFLNSVVNKHILERSDLVGLEFLKDSVDSFKKEIKQCLAKNIVANT